MKRKPFVNRLLALSGSSLLAVSLSQADTLTWDANGTTAGQADGAGTWDTGSNWWDGLANLGWTSGDSAVFGQGGAGGAVSLTEPTTVGSLTFNSFTGTYTLGTAGQTITLNGGIKMNLGAGAATISSPVTLGAAQSWTNHSSGLLTIGTGAIANGGYLLTIGGTGNTTISGAIGGTGGLTKSGIGTLILSGVNDYSGTTTVAGGTLTLRRQTGALSSSSALTFGGSGIFDMDNTGATGALSQSLGVLTFSTGDGTVRITRTAAQNQTITFASLSARAAGATANFVNGGGTNGASNGFKFTTAPTSGQLIDRGFFFNGSAYAAYDSGGFVRGLIYGTDTNAMAALSGNANATLGSIDATKSAQFNGGTAATTTLAVAFASGATSITVANGAAFKIGQAITGTGIASNTYVTNIVGNVLSLSVGTSAANSTLSTQFTPYHSISAQTTGSVNTLHLAGNGAVLSLSPGETLSVNGILRTGHAANVFSGINGGTGIKTVDSGGEMVIRTDLSGDALFIATPILDNGGSSLTKTGAGTLNLTATNTYTGNTYVNAGTLAGSGIRTSSTTYVESGATILPSNNANFSQLHLRGGTLNASNGSTGIAGTVTLAPNITSFLTSGGTGTISANIGGTGNLQVTTTSRQLYLTGDNNYSGTTTLLAPVSTGAVVFGRAGALYNGDSSKWTPENIIVASGAALGIRGGNGTTTGFSSAQVSSLLGNMTTSNGNGLFAGSSIFFDANGGFNYSGSITDSTGSSGGAVGVQIYGSTLTLSGNNTYSGPTVFRPYNTGAVGLSVASFNSVNNGNPLMESSSLGRPTTTANGTIQMGTDTFQSSHTLTYTGAGETTDRVLNINGNSSSTMTISQSGSGLLKFTSAVTKTGGATNYTPFVLTGAGNGEFATALPGFGAFTKSGNGTWTLGGSVGASGSNGAKSISAGTLVFRAGGFNATGNTTISANAGFIYNANSDSILTIAGGATNTFTLTGGTTVLGGSIGSTTTSARINVNAGTTASATGNIRVNIYGISGVTPTAGTNNYVLLQSNATTNTLDGATYTLGTVFNNTNFTVGSTIGETGSTVTASITQTAQLGTAYWRGTGTAGLSKVWAASNGNASSPDSNWSTTAGGSVQALIPGTSTDVIIPNSTPTAAPTGTSLGSDMSIKSLTISDTVNGLGIIASAVDSYKLTLGSGGLTMDASVPASSIAAPVGLGASQTWTNNSINTLTVSGIVSGAADLTIAGSGTTVLSGANTYTGKTSINAGTLSINRIFGVSGGSSSVGAPTTAANGTIAIGSGSSSASLVYTGLATTTNRVIDLAGTTGGATLDQSGTGLLKFTSAFTASGAGSKTLTLQGSTAGSGEIAGAIVDNSGSNTTSLTKQGTGTWIVSGANTYSGGTNIAAGTLSFANGSLGSSGNINFTGNSALQWNGTNTQDVSSRVVMNNGVTSTFDTNGNNVIFSSAVGSLSTGALVKNGAGTLTLNGSNTYTGTTTVSAGTMLVNGSLGNTAVTVSAGAFGGSGSIGSTLNLAGGSFHVVDLSDPLQVLGNVSIYSGFGVANLAGLTWGSVDDGTYTLIDGNLATGVFVSLANNSIATAFDIGGGRSAYFQEGSLRLVVIPETSTVLLGGLGMLALMRRRR